MDLTRALLERHAWLMGRSLRFEYAGAFYHVMARGSARGRIFLQEADRALFLRTLAEAAGRTGWRVHEWSC